MANSNNPENKVFHDPEGREIHMADDDRMTKYFDTDLYKILCIEVLEFDPSEILVTDESSFNDFPEEREYYVKRVQEVFNIDISDMEDLYIPDVLDRVVDSRKPIY